MIYKKLILASALLLILVLTSCNNNDDIGDINNNCTITGEGAIVTKTLDLPYFSGINLSLTGNVNITQGTAQIVEVVGQSNIITDLSTSVINNFWTIGFEGNCSYNYNELTINITVPKIDKLELSGSGNIIVNNFTNQNNSLNISLSGSGQLNLNEFEGITSIDFQSSGDINANLNKTITTLNELKIRLSGSGSLNITEAGTLVQILTLNLIGDGNYNGFNIKANTCTITSSGSGYAKVTVNDTLNATLSGSGNISYKGYPIINQNISGYGQIIDAN
ncbi:MULTISPECIES: head GIN domain-containing protein [unclassified Tenacibaculum]|uniref:head GIN domain-containing protein n=1 Tax=unclassified Tenacibaculum TaxID=2635139 RepID=UPI001F37B303|nr:MULTISPECIES: head GIN domain-containing protein [unclassified Tenacibaculum]MCF2875241.1 DUF2807 domain-containing protein [Tenacibaculum sp. Cn5-1]MCF2935317.1 DUF2807 domain-containing protein [Tenacibaculum sp. Cn5-34]MCG7511241.1 DUF2807 domain-containing protein [Tenacibaculum sp. Cn5-46]